MRRTFAVLAPLAFSLAACPASPPDVGGDDTTTSGGSTSAPGTTSSSTGTSTAQEDLESSSGGRSSEDGSSFQELEADAGMTSSSSSTGEDETTPEPPALAFRSGESTPEIGGRNTPSVFDLCPFDHFLVGIEAWLAVDPEALRDGAPVGIAGLCARAFVLGDELVLERSVGLLRHGVPAAEETQVSVRCPEGAVVTGLGGRVGTYATTEAEDSPIVDFLDAFTLTCAPMTGSATAIEIGPPTDLDPVGMVDDPDHEVIAPHRCPEGMLARGLQVYSGLWIDALALWCSAPRLTVPNASACESGSDCTSGVCEAQVCRSDACPPDCTCAVYEGFGYAFCEPIGEDQDDSAEHCSMVDGALARVEDAVENAWLTSTANAFDFEVLRLGGNDRETEGTWQWHDGDVFHRDDGPVEGHYTAWYEDEPDNGGDEGEDCLELLLDGRWSDHICDESIPFVCERELP